MTEARGNSSLIRHWIIIVAAAGVVNAQSKATEGLLETVPDSLHARLELRAAQVLASQAAAVREAGLAYVLAEGRLWPPGTTITVGIKGASPSLCKEIERVAVQWTLHGNIKLDFGGGTNGNGYRSWSDSDTQYAANIRVAFEPGGYWSTVGSDAVSPSICHANETSLNLHGFNLGLPANWEAIVLHEFGHALGFQHEHQNPGDSCDSEFRWFDDAGYVPTRESDGHYVRDSKQRYPGIYTVLGGPPNEWPRSKADYNLRQLAMDGTIASARDRLSVMHYSFPAWMFKSGSNSPCCVTENTRLSDNDKLAMRLAYPSGAAEADQRTKVRGELMRAVWDGSGDTSGREAFLKSIETLKSDRK